MNNEHNENYNITFEHSILGSLLFEPSQIEQVNIDPEIFYLPKNKEIFEVMLELDRNGMPVDEEFIMKVLSKRRPKDIGLYEENLVHIMAKNPISNINAYVGELNELYKKRLIKKEITALYHEVEEFSSSEALLKIDKINNNLKENIKSDLFEIKNSDDVVEKLPEFYLKDTFPIQKNEITMFSAKGGTGKSFLALLILLLLKKEHKLNVFGYFSEDDVGVTKHRINILEETHNTKMNIDFIGKETRPEQFIEYDKAGNLHATPYFYEFTKKLKPYDFVLLDPLIAFIAKDENSNVEARFFMNLINEWCVKEDKTVLFIHHHDKSDIGARGAGGFVDAIRLHYIISKEKDEKEKDKTLDTPFRIANLIKMNHYKGPTQFKIQLFPAPKPKYRETTFEMPTL